MALAALSRRRTTSAHRDSASLPQPWASGNMPCLFLTMGGGKTQGLCSTWLTSSSLPLSLFTSPSTKFRLNSHWRSLLHSIGFNCVPAWGSCIRKLPLSHTLMLELRELKSNIETFPSAGLLSCLLHPPPVCFHLSGVGHDVIQAEKPHQNCTGLLCRLSAKFPVSGI